MPSIIKKYNPVTNFIMPENEDCFWVRGGMTLRKNFSSKKALLHLLWQNPAVKNCHKTS